MSARALKAPTAPPASDTPSWFTPLPWFLELERQLLFERRITSAFDLDPCGHRQAPVSQAIQRRGGMVFTARENGLRRPWPPRSVVFANPDYQSEALDIWAPYMRDQGAKGHTVVALLPAWPDRAWWHAAVEPGRRAYDVHVRFLPGRMRFGWPTNPTGIDGHTARFPSAVIIWGQQ